MLTAVAEQQMLEQVDKLAVVVDSSKVGNVPNALCSTKQIDIVITGKDANPEVVKRLSSRDASHPSLNRRAN